MKYNRINIILVTLALLFISCKNNSSSFSSDLDTTRKEVQQTFDLGTWSIVNEKLFLDSLEKDIGDGLHHQTPDFIVQLIKQNPKNKRLRVLLGISYTQRNVFDSAYHQFALAMADYEYPYALDKRAKMFLRQGNLKAAIHDYHQAFLMDSHYSKQLGDCYNMDGLRDSARKYFRIYEELNSKN